MIPRTTSSTRSLPDTKLSKVLRIYLQIHSEVSKQELALIHKAISVVMDSKEDMVLVATSVEILTVSKEVTASLRVVMASILNRVAKDNNLNRAAILNSHLFQDSRTLSRVREAMAVTTNIVATK